MRVKGHRSAHLIVVIWLLLAGRTVAQDAPTRTTQPEQNYILSWTGEVLYPQALHFTVALGRLGAEVALARLTLIPESGDPVVLDMNLQDALVVRAPYAELAYTYVLPAAAPPPLFSTIRYRWDVLTTQSETARIDDSLVMADGRVTWIVDEAVNPSFSLTLPDVSADTQAIVATLRRTLRPVYERLAVDLGTSPVLQVMVYPDELSQSIPPGCVQSDSGGLVAQGLVTGIEQTCDLQMADQVLRVSKRTLVRVPTVTTANLQAEITRQLVDRFYQPAWAGKDVPAWFLNGIQSLYLPASNRNSYGTLAAVARTGSLLSLDVMRQPPESAANRDLWHAQSEGMVLYIAAQSGIDRVIQLARSLESAGSFDAAYESSTGRALSALLPDLRRWLFTSGAPAAFGLNLYAPATATPTVTRTATPTATLTPSATPTLTPTATVTGVLTFTPLPTFTPTSTRTLAPVTVTPRPPGSLDAPPPAAASSYSSAALLVMGAALLVAIIVLLLSLFRRR